MIRALRAFALATHDFLNTWPVYGFVFLLLLFGGWCCCYYAYLVLRRCPGEQHDPLTRTDKVAFVVFLAISLTWVLDWILAGDLYEDHPPEIVARLFACAFCNGRLHEGASGMGYYVAPAYQEAFAQKWCAKGKEFSRALPPEPARFELVEEHYEQEKCFIVLRAGMLLKVSSRTAARFLTVTKDGRAFVQHDLEICLERTPLQSRFLGQYLRWRVRDLHCTRSEW